MLDVERRKIISDLNNLLNDFSYLSNLAEFCDNNYETMIKMVSKIIKYAFCRTVTTNLGYLNTPVKVDEDYKKYLIQNKKRFGFMKKQVGSDFLFELDSDIRMSDLQGLELPSINRMIDACRVNTTNKEEELQREERQCVKYKEAMGFQETALWYSTTDLVVFDSDFLYYHSYLSGNPSLDFYNLYHDERYLNNPNSPLKESFNDNLERILKFNDIDITRIGKLHVIGNGRHRILYLMNCNCDYPIPVSVNKRIEDREFNEILIRIKNRFNITVHKNNICNEEANIIINYNNKTYNTKNREELKRFEELLLSNGNLDEFYVCDYNYINRNKKSDTFAYERDRMLVFWINNQKLNIFEGNYTDYLKLTGKDDSNVLFDAFSVNQKIYQKYKLLGLNFEDNILYRLADSTDEKDKMIKELFEESEREEMENNEKKI